MDEQPSGRQTAVVERVSDGDTVRLVGLGRVRLIGIDTPEVFGGCDRYGRLLAYVWLRDGRMFNLLLAERGYATPLTIPPNVDYADRFVAAARRARRAGLGLWRACA